MCPVLQGVCRACCREPGVRRVEERFWRQAASSAAPKAAKGAAASAGGVPSKLKQKRAVLPKRKALQALTKATRWATVQTVSLTTPADAVQVLGLSCLEDALGVLAGSLELRVHACQAGALPRAGGSAACGAHVTAAGAPE